MTTPYFSIIIPMYNVERYIKICVDSILNQTFQDFEIIIVDDYSTDNSYEICNKLYGNNEKIRLFRHEKNYGIPSFGRNYGLEKAVGKYIWFIDNDDAIFPNALEKLYKITQPDGGEVDTVHFLGGYLTSQDDDQPISLANLNINWENRNEGFLSEDIPRRLAENWATNRIAIATWKSVYSREFLIKNKIKFLDCRIEDMTIAFEAMCFSKKYFMLREAVYVWRQRNSSLSHTINANQFKVFVKSLIKVSAALENVMNKIPEIKTNRLLREKCTLQIIEYIFPNCTTPFYNGMNVPLELDSAAYESLLPIFGENTTIVKYLFHGCNIMWRQSNILAQQVQVLRQQESIIQKQNQLIERLKKLLDEYDK